MDNQMNQQIGAPYGIRGFPTIKVSVHVFNVYSPKKSYSIVHVGCCRHFFMMTARFTHDCFTSLLEIMSVLCDSGHLLC